jgi:large subunit ribosomal protein L15
MTLTNLPKVKTIEKRRVGQGISAGQGKTCGRGTKGQNSRTGHKLRPGFEGGQMPLAQRLPKKRGFVARKAKLQTVTLEMLSKFKDGSKITNDFLIENGIINFGSKAKIVGDAKFDKKMTVSVDASKNAAKMIIAAGGKIEKN